ncbi:molybdate transport system substrate-binding protein [Stackebrandtia endophytica]|uniref:Molybdate transport system substrate-binding protein n=1 Tax=Stackebrandtia endophytica TaxID=1496996 RepID=A0A543AWL4_9ACTN|nr:molybdate ABC transporter substrate-binding protein [Stackebrandtia endophytica]TQL76966.1 molybdate transport system substrate-binding protein [Stackebrandtia endophytica]
MTAHSTLRRALATLGVAAVAATGCTAADATDADTITVFAAASLTEVFTDLGERFEADNPGTTVNFSFAGSSGLAQQILGGAPADVFASAATTNMDQVSAETASAPRVFATNELEIAVPPGNPGDVTGLADFADPDLTIAICEASVPCGQAATAAFEAAGITPQPDTLERDVKAVVTKVVLGEVDAGLVYRTDVLAADVTGITFPESAHARNDYPIATLKTASHPNLAESFVEYVLSEVGHEVLSAAGFTTP